MTKGKSKHTPGPWKVAEFAELTDFNTYEKSFGVTTEKFDEPWGYRPYIVTEPGKEPDENWGTVSADDYKANAHLIAAAPELLEACEYAEEWLNDHQCLCGERTECTKCLAIMQIRKAIKKAKGDF